MLRAITNSITVHDIIVFAKVHVQKSSIHNSSRGTAILKVDDIEVTWRGNRHNYIQRATDVRSIHRKYLLSRLVLNVTRELNLYTWRITCIASSFHNGSNEPMDYGKRNLNKPERV